MCVQISISSSAFREPKLGTPFSLSVPGACVLSSQKQTRKQALKAQCAGGDTPVMTKVLRAGAQRQQINMPQGIREGFSEERTWGWFSKEKPESFPPGRQVALPRKCPGSPHPHRGLPKESALSADSTSSHIPKSSHHARITASPPKHAHTPSPRRCLASQMQCDLGQVT